jgi:hypothetical protein
MITLPNEAFFTRSLNIADPRMYRAAIEDGARC